MRIPLLIDTYSYGVYKPLDVIIKCLVKETSRKTTNENCKWNDDFLPPLKNICLQTISKNFEKYPIINSLPEFLQQDLIGMLSCDINLRLAVFVIDVRNFLAILQYFGLKLKPNLNQNLRVKGTFL